MSSRYKFQEAEGVAYANIDGTLCPLTQLSYKLFEKTWGYKFPEKTWEKLKEVLDSEPENG